MDFNKPLSAEEQRLLPGVLLGKRIFEDTSLSEPPGLACTSCHDPATAYRGSNHSSIPAVPAGSRPGMFGSRKTPSIAYEAYSPPFSFARRLNDVTGEPEIVPVGGQFWDGRAGDLQEQVAGPLLDPREMNNASLDAVVERIRKGPYAELVRNVYGPQAFDQPGLFAKLAASIASYEESPRFKLFSSKFDDWLEGRTLLTDQEWRGYQLFVDKQKGNCLSCHDGGGSDEGGKTGPTDPANLSRNPRNWLFTDFTYDTLGVPRNRALPDNADPAHYDLGLCARANLQDLAPKGFDVSKLCGAFKVPSLRNVAVSGPYMHNGAFSNLRDAVAFYFTRDTDPGHWYRADMKGGIDKYDDLPAQYKSNVNTGQAPYDRHMGEPPRASDDEIDAIVAFLRTLTDKQFLTGAGSLTDAKK
ncbi:cytochrome-c peroxidase [Labrys neptuniae]